MDWFHCLLWVTLASTSAVDYEFPDWREDGNPTIRPHRPHRPHRIDNTTRPNIRHRPPETNERQYERLIERTGERTSERTGERTGERSIAVDSAIQRVQDQERKRLSNRRIDDTRNMNGTYKIVNRYPSVGTRVSQDKDQVVFPGPTSASRDLTPIIPEECKELRICETVPNYPTDIVSRHIAQLGDDKRYRLHADVIDEPEITQRLGPVDSNIELCHFTEKLVYPSAAPATDGKWYFIVNTKKDRLQGLRVEICDTKRTACGEGFAYFQTGYIARCKQKYVIRQMAALDKDGTVKYDMNFYVPSCCSCVLTKTDKK